MIFQRSDALYEYVVFFIINQPPYKMVYILKLYVGFSHD